MTPDEMIEVAAKAACNQREAILPKRWQSFQWEEKPEEEKERWRKSIIAARNALGLDHNWRPSSLRNGRFVKRFAEELREGDIVTVAYYGKRHYYAVDTNASWVVEDNHATVDVEVWLSEVDEQRNVIGVSQPRTYLSWGRVICVA